MTINTYEFLNGLLFCRKQTVWTGVIRNRISFFCNSLKIETQTAFLPLENSR